MINSQTSKIKKVLRNPFLKLLLSSAIFTVWVLWMEIYWLFAGLILLTDVHLTKFINWRFWRRRKPAGKRYSWTTEFLDSIIWAVLIAVFFRIFLFEAYSIPTSSMEKTLLVGDYILVSKARYGPRLPITPITIPFTHNKYPFGDKLKNSFVSSTQLPYRRLKGIAPMKHFDVVVFNYPEGDTVIQELPDKSYYTQCRQYGTEQINANYHLLYRPVDKRDNYVKRVIGLPGDTIRIQHGIASINNKQEKLPKGVQYNYSIKVLDTESTDLFDSLGINKSDIHPNDYNSIYTLPLTFEQYFSILDSSYYKAIVKYENIDPTKVNRQIFPFDERFPWTEDNYGPIGIPKRGHIIELNTKNLPLYKRIITAYEGNILSVDNDSIFINGENVTQYTFKMDYYFMLGDNRHNSNDSRYWGFVPENHIIGRARLTWLSINKNKNFPDNIRWDKIVKFIH